MMIVSRSYSTNDGRILVCFTNQEYCMVERAVKAASDSGTAKAWEDPISWFELQKQLNAEEFITRREHDVGDEE